MQKWRIVLASSAITLEVYGFVTIEEGGTLVVSRNGSMSTLTHAFPPGGYQYAMILNENEK